MWGETCRRATILSDQALVSVMYIALKIPWYGNYCTERTMRYGTILYVVVVSVCVIPLRWGIAVVAC